MGRNRATLPRPRQRSARNLGCGSLDGSVIVLDQPLHGVEVELIGDGLHGLARMPQVEDGVEGHVDALDDRPPQPKRGSSTTVSVELA